MARLAARGLNSVLVWLLVSRACAFGQGKWISAQGRVIKKKNAVTEPTLFRRGARSLCRHRRTAIAVKGREVSTSPSLSERTDSSLAFVHELIRWLKSKDPAATLDECINISVFGGSLRGTKWTCPVPSRDELRAVASIPTRKVLRSSYSSPTWDAELALQILDEHRKGPASAFYPYIDFLTSGQRFSADTCPAPLAPHAIRHWTKEQRAPLATSNAGRRLLGLSAEQDSLWRTKFETLCSQNSQESPSWEQFRWAMEAVHSRAYLGASMETPSAASLAATTAPTIIAALIGLLYADDLELMVPPQFFWSGLAVLATLPLVSSLLRPPPKSAVMLPLIDVANHNANAESSIRFDPISNSFELVVNLRRCVDQSDGQLFVSYGGKSDTELLLNYGFVPNNAKDSSPFSHHRDSSEEDIDFGEDDDCVRSELASKFNIRNASVSITA